MGNAGAKVTQKTMHLTPVTPSLQETKTTLMRTGDTNLINPNLQFACRKTNSMQAHIAMLDETQLNLVEHYAI
jgi:hypothetical protein